MAELAETRLVSDVAPDAPQLLPAALVGTEDYRPGGYEHPRSDHTNVHTYLTYHSKHVSISFCKAFQDCKCCHDDAIVGANVGTEGKLGKEHGNDNSNCNGGGANVGANVGPVGNGDSKCNGNSTSNSNGIRFSEEVFYNIIAMATHGNNVFPDQILPKLSDHGCLIATCEDFKRRFPCQLQSRRDRLMKKRLHGVRFEIPENKAQITKFVDTSIDISKIDAHKVDEPEHDIVVTVESSLTKHGFEGTADKDRCIDDDARCFGGHVPVGDVDDASLRPESVFFYLF